ncbi:MAG: hypothetical protein LBD16_03060 [Oscillospiraceae bacterium]|nr:hypothetical protein [Oscillospiraceae bacterium]
MEELLRGNLNDDALVYETDLTDEEIWVMNERVEACHKDPSSAVSLDDL